MIAEKIFGRKYKTIKGKGNKISLEPGAINNVTDFNPEPPYYSTDIAAAWDVVEKLKLLERFSLTLRQLSPTNTAWTLSDLRDGEPIAWSETAPHAICLAALKAVNK